MPDKPCPDINESLAKAKGYVERPAGIHKCRWFPSGRQRGIGQPSPPDFCGDSKYTGALLEELPDYVRVEIGDSIHGDRTKQFRCSITRNLVVLGVGYGDTRIEAIARAAEAMIEEAG